MSRTQARGKPKEKRLSRAGLTGELPGEYMKRALVSIPLGFFADEGRIPEDHYIVRTMRRDNEWRVTVEYKGNVWEIPHKVVMQISRHMDSIVKAQRHDRGVEQSMIRRGELKLVEEE